MDHRLTSQCFQKPFYFGGSQVPIHIQHLNEINGNGVVQSAFNRFRRGRQIIPINNSNNSSNSSNSSNISNSSNGSNNVNYANNNSSNSYEINYEETKDTDGPFPIQISLENGNILNPFDIFSQYAIADFQNIHYPNEINNVVQRIRDNLPITQEEYNEFRNIFNSLALFGKLPSYGNIPRRIFI